MKDPFENACMGAILIEIIPKIINVNNDIPKDRNKEGSRDKSIKQQWGISHYQQYNLTDHYYFYYLLVMPTWVSSLFIISSYQP